MNLLCTQTCAVHLRCWIIFALYTLLNIQHILAKCCCLSRRALLYNVFRCDNTIQIRIILYITTFSPSPLSVLRKSYWTVSIYKTTQFTQLYNIGRLMSVIMWHLVASHQFSLTEYEVSAEMQSGAFVVVGISASGLNVVELADGQRLGLPSSYMSCTHRGLRFVFPS